MLIIPIELVEALFGPFVAANFDSFLVAAMLLALLIFAFKQQGRGRSDDWLKNAQERQQKRYEYEDPYFAKSKPGPEPKDSKIMFESGWSWNEENKLWEPPSNASAESKKKWEWDAERQIWVDVEQQKRLERYNEFRKKQGKGPTYEEWKAAREAERNKENN